MQVPEVRLFMADDTIAYAVIKGPNGWYGMPGLRKGQFLSDEDVKGAIPLQPGPSVVADVRYTPGKADGEGFGDDSFCDVDINGRVAARRVSSFIAGAYIVAAAVQAGGPVMVRAAQKTADVVALTPRPQPKLAVVPDRND